MYVTEQLPSSTYEIFRAVKNKTSNYEDNKMIFPKQKKNTAYLDKVFHRPKLYQPEDVKE